MSPTAFYLSAAITAMQKDIAKLPVSIRRDAMIQDTEVLRDMLKRATS